MQKPKQENMLARSIRPWMVCLIVSILYVTIVLIQHRGDALALVVLPSAPSDQYPEGFEGYDGQFTYVIALDPLMSPPYLDVPAYRLQRILLPLLGHLLAFGQRDLVPWSILAINITVLVAGTHMLERLLAASGVNRWLALVYGLFPGILMPVRLSLNEPLAYGLALAAVWLALGGRLLWGAAVLGLAALAKETTLIFTVGCLGWLTAERRWKDVLRFGLIAIAPFLTWQATLLVWLGDVGIGSGGNYSTPFEIIPYMGLFRIYVETENLRAFFAFALVLVPLAVVPSLWGIVASVRDLVRGSRHVFVFLLLVNSLIIPFTPFSTFRELLGMLRFLPGLVCATLLYGAHFRRRRLLLLSSILWLASLAAVLVSG